MYKILIKYKSKLNKTYWMDYLTEDETGNSVEFGTDRQFELEAELKKLSREYGLENIRVINDVDYGIILDVADEFDMENATVATSEDVDNVFNEAFEKVFGGV